MLSYRKRCDTENGVQDVLPGSEFFVLQSYWSTLKSKNLET